ncbi:MAG: sodium:proton antiporter [Verrucomicrobiota bacterium]|jgi:Na+/H+ antiporter NhaD/arsenite permease-like protein
MILPFGLLLAAMAVAPGVWPAWWARHYPKVAFGLGAVTAAYYIFALQAFERVVDVGHEYFSFIVLLGSLFVVAGGIHLHLKGQATPGLNTLFLFLGAILANVLGTTGASLLLIRPWIRMNKDRVTAHHIVFFIFIVSNVGGCLTPVGDPPLFLGYLKGIPFWWVAAHCWPMWAVAVAFLLGLFYLVDRLNYCRAPRQTRLELAGARKQWPCQGLGSLAWLLVILGAVFVNHPLFLREALMAAAAAASYFTTSKSVHEANHFDFHPIQQVAILFAGIFATMMPALDWLQTHAGQLANPSPAFFYWTSGSLSCLLDNAPTYLGSLSAIFGRFVAPETVDQVQALIQSHGAAGPHEGPIWRTFQALQQHHAAALAAGMAGPDEIKVAFLLANNDFNAYLVAISLGAVFFGAITYIGNGPNFMVKAIADHQKIHTPGFLGFIFKYALPCMAPLLLLIWLLFLRRWIGPGNA